MNVKCEASTCNGGTGQTVTHGRLMGVYIPTISLAIPSSRCLALGQDWSLQK